MKKFQSTGQRAHLSAPRAFRPSGGSRSGTVQVPVFEAPPSVEEKNMLKTPEWLPAQVEPAIGFLNATDFDIKAWEPYKAKLAKVLEDPSISQLYGWKKAPETINGRLAMLGFVAAAAAEVLGAGPIVNQLAAGTQATLLVTVAVAIGSSIPLVKGVQGEYLESLRESYTVPEGLFTESMERVHGRLAMLGLSVLMLVELVKGSALF